MGNNDGADIANDKDLTHVVMLHKGEVVMPIEAIKETLVVSEEKPKEPVVNLFNNFKGQITLKEATFDEKAFLNQLLGNSYLTAELISTNYPRYNGTKLPKKKRIRNKWKKNYQTTEVHEGLKFKIN